MLASRRIAFPSSAMSAILAMVALAMWAGPAFGKRCTSSQRVPLPDCVEITETDSAIHNANITRGQFAKERKVIIRKYTIKNFCNRKIKIHEDIVMINDKGYILKSQDSKENRKPNWFEEKILSVSYRNIECCNVRTRDYNYTCDN